MILAMMDDDDYGYDDDDDDGYSCDDGVYSCDDLVRIWAGVEKLTIVFLSSTTSSIL